MPRLFLIPWRSSSSNFKVRIIRRTTGLLICVLNLDDERGFNVAVSGSASSQPIPSTHHLQAFVTNHTFHTSSCSVGRPITRSWQTAAGGHSCTFTSAPNTNPILSFPQHRPLAGTSSMLHRCPALRLLALWLYQRADILHAAPGESEA